MGHQWRRRHICSSNEKETKLVCTNDDHINSRLEVERSITWRVETWAFWLGVYSHLLKKDKYDSSRK